MAGVSTATVSRCLNQPDRVKQPTRDQVQQAIDELGYTPHFGARALASNQTGTVGAVIPTMDNAIFARGLQAVEEELAAAGSTLLVATSNYDPDRELEQIKALIARGIDGLILIGESRPPATYEFLNRREVRFLLAWCWSPNSDHVCVGFDNRQAACQLAEQVIAFGHRDICMIAGIGAWNDRATARLDGVRDALLGAGLSLRDDQIEEAQYTLEDGAAACKRILDRHPQTTAIICGNDVLAVGAMKATKARGLIVPDDISVCGFDNIDLAKAVEPQLTTVQVPHRRMGRAAATHLLKVSKSSKKPHSIRFETKIIHRATLAPPKTR